MKTCYFIFALVISLIGPAANATDITGSCLVSFNVKDKMVFSGGEAMSCVSLEQRRVDLFQKINALPKTGIIKGADLAAKLNKIEADLKQLEDQNDWKGFSLSVSGNVLATLGLASCVETAGGGCALAIVSKAIAVVSTIDSAAGESEKKKQARELRLAIDEIRQQIGASTPSANQIREQLILDFNGMCADVKASCLSD